jgi:hypothetical protein
MQSTALICCVAAHPECDDDLSAALEAMDVSATGVDWLAAAIKFLEVLLMILKSVGAQSYSDEDEARKVIAQRIGDGKLLERLARFLESPLGKLLLERLFAGLLPKA